MLLYMTTQLEKDVASNAGIIPIFPWLKNGKSKDNLIPSVYASLLLEAKGEGSIQRCDQDCPYGSIFWRAPGVDSALVPTGWTNYGGMAQFTQCSFCKRDEIEDGIIDEDDRRKLELDREDIDVLGSGTTGSTSSHYNKPLINKRAKIRERFDNIIEKRNQIAEAKRLFGSVLRKSEMDNLLNNIVEDKRKEHANAAEDRKRKKDDEEYFKSKKNKITGGKRRRKKRTRRRRKSRRKSRRKKKHRKKRTRRRRK